MSFDVTRRSGSVNFERFPFDTRAGGEPISELQSGEVHMFVSVIAFASLAAASPQSAQEREVISKTVAAFEKHVSDPSRVRFRSVRLGKAEMMGNHVSLVLCGEVAFDDPRLPAGWNKFFQINSNGNFQVGGSADVICNATVFSDKRDFSARLKAAFSQ